MHAFPIQCMIVDDEPRATANLEALLREYPGVGIAAIVHDPEQAVDLVSEHRPHLVFLDIQMPGKSGFDIARDLAGMANPPRIIFVTAFDQFAIEAIRHAAFDFLVKPVNPAELRQALLRFESSGPAIDTLDQLKKLIEHTLAQPKLRFSTANGFILIDPAEIVYLQADWNYAEIFLSHDKKEMVTIHLGALEKLLPPRDFFRISRSVIINARYLNRVNRKKRLALLVKNGEEYPIPVPLLNIRKLEGFLDRMTQG